MRAGAALVPALALALAPVSATAFPDGPPWEALDDAAGCTACHSDTSPLAAGRVLMLEGLPAQPRPGGRYRLHIRLRDAEMRRAGYLLGLRMEGGTPGTLAACDDRSEAQGARARSTAAGSAVTGEGDARWCLDWRGPERITGAIRVVLWANAANGDESPFGDHIYAFLTTIGQTDKK